MKDIKAKSVYQLLYTEKILNFDQDILEEVEDDTKGEYLQIFVHFNRFIS